MRFIYACLITIAFGFSASINAQNIPGATCDSAIPVECGLSYTGSTVGVPTSGSSLCANEGTGGQIWYSYTASETGAAAVSTCGSSFDTRLHIYSGTCDGLICLAENDDYCAFQSRVIFSVTAGESYLIRCGGFSIQEGLYTMTVACGANTEGCTNASAVNFNPTAIFDNGTCVYAGCTDSIAMNYNPMATIDDGSCMAWVFGCTNPAAANYDSAANSDNGSCIIEGCMDATAANYNALATIDNGSCQYCNGAGSVMAALYICTFSNGNQVELQIVDDAGNEVYYATGLNSGSIVNAQICLRPGVCYTANMINNTGPLGWYNGYFWVNVNGVQVINAHPSVTAQFESAPFSIDGTCGPIFGCTDPTALNYNVEANLSDNSCVYPTIGCTDSTAVNYDPLAAQDNGSCIYMNDCAGSVAQFILYPGTFVNEASYIVVDASGAVVAASVTGVASSYACMADGCYTIQMFDSFGDGWDGTGYMEVYMNGALSGSYNLASGNFGTAYFGVNAEGCAPVVLGCTDALALNYNPMATDDDGSCQYPLDCNQNLLSVTVTTGNWGSEISWSLVGEDSVTYSSGSGYSSWGWYNTSVCVPDGCYEVVMNDSWGDGWNGAYYMISSNTMYAEGSLFYGANGSDLIGVNSTCGMIAGCMDAAALNYNPQANYDDGSCVFNAGQGLGINNGLEVDFSLYPNPTNGGIIVNANALDIQKTLTLNVYGAEGRLVHSLSYNVSGSTMQIAADLSELPAGYYLVQLVNGTSSQVKPLIKQ